jgi:acetyl-CoA acetyltransferase
MTVDEVLAARMISAPLTLPMCSPIGDGAAAAVIVSPKIAAEMGLRAPVQVRSSVLASGFDVQNGEADFTTVTARAAYEAAGIGAEDVNCVELHDAAASAELTQYETLGLCGPGEGPALLASGATALGGRVPVNTTGGLMRKGHPIGATGLAQIVELTRQLRGEAGQRQVEGAKVALAANGGGFLRGDTAAMVISLLSR